MNSSKKQLIILLVILGIGPLVVAVLLRRRHPGARSASLAVGIALVIWITVEILVIGYHRHPPLQAIYGSLGVMILVLAGAVGRVTPE